MNDTSSVAKQVASLPSIPLPDLWALWDRFFKSRPEKTNRVYLESRISYKLQEEAFGGLDPDTRRRLANIGAVAVMPLKRKMRRTAPTLGEQAKKIPTDKSRDFMNGGNLKYERAAAEVGIFSKNMSNAHL